MGGDAERLRDAEARQVLHGEVVLGPHHRAQVRLGRLSEAELDSAAVLRGHLQHLSAATVVGLPQHEAGGAGGEQLGEGAVLRE